MATKIIYPGTFDPITNGHIDIINRALRLFDKVIVAIAASNKKGTVFVLDERVELVRHVLHNHANVEVREFSGLLVDFTRETKIFTVLRGLRAISDFEYELMLADLNKRLEPQLETIFLTPTEQYTYLSASMIREIAALGGDVSQFVPNEVAKALAKKFR